jgi:hypothetical protein
MIKNLLLDLFMALFGMKLLWNLSVPYVGIMRVWKGAGKTVSISLMPVLEIVFLLAWAILASVVGGATWVCNVRIVAIVGISGIVLSYVHMAVVGFLGGLLCSWFRRRRPGRGDGVSGGP